MNLETDVVDLTMDGSDVDENARNNVKDGKETERYLKIMMLQEMRKKLKINKPQKRGMKMMKKTVILSTQASMESVVMET